MPTADRTTIKAAVDEFVSKLRTNLVADPPTSAKPFRFAEVGATGVEEYPRPFLSVLIASARPLGVVNDDKIMEVTATIRLVVDVTQADPHDAILDAVGVPITGQIGLDICAELDLEIPSHLHGSRE